MKKNRFRQSALWSTLCVSAVFFGCGRDEKHQLPKSAADRTPASHTGMAPIDLPKAEPKPGVAVVVLVDTSGSMAHSVRNRAGQSQPKYEIAREALDRV